MEEMVTAYVDESTWQAKLQDMAHRNASVEMSPSPDVYTDGKLPVFRVRLLDMTNDALLIEFPPTPDALKLFRAKGIVRIVTCLDHTRWELFAQVVKRVKLKLNNSKFIPALQLTLPLVVQSDQRRDYFRATTAGMNIQPVVMFPLESRESHPPHGDLRELYESINRKSLGVISKPQPSDPIMGRLLNISGEGVGMAIDIENAPTVVNSDWFWIQIDLPTSDNPIRAFAHAVLFDQQTADVFHLGFHLDWSNPIAAKEAVEDIVRFSTWVQRSQLKKRRDA